VVKMNQLSSLVDLGVGLREISSKSSNYPREELDRQVQSLEASKYSSRSDCYPWYTANKTLYSLNRQLG
jgi:hypothetical protein